MLGDALKALHAPRLVLTLGLCGLVVLTVPEPWASQFFFTGLRQDYGRWLGIGTLAALAYSLLGLLMAMAAGWGDAQRERRRDRTRLANLRMLSPQETAYLDFCRQSGQMTFTAAPLDPVIQGLIHKGLAEQFPGPANTYGAAFTVLPVVFEHLQENPLALPQAQPESPGYQAYLREIARQHGRRV